MFPLSVTFESLNQMTSILSARREFYLTQMIFYVPAHQPNTVYRAGERTYGRHDNARLLCALSCVLYVSAHRLASTRLACKDKKTKSVFFDLPN